VNLFGKILPRANYWFCCLLVFPSLSSCHEKAMVALYFGRG